MSSKCHKPAARGARTHRSRLAPHAEVKTSSASSISSCEPLIRTILVPVDFSDCSLAGLTYAVRLAKGIGARIIVLHVTDLGPVMMSLGDYDSPAHLNAARHRSRDQMQAFVQRVDFKGVPLVTSALAGYCPEAIYKAAAKQGADLIVMSTHGRTGLRHALLGSVTEDTVRRAALPVLVVPSLIDVSNSHANGTACRRKVPAPAKAL